MFTKTKGDLAISQPTEYFKTIKAEISATESPPIKFHKSKAISKYGAKLAFKCPAKENCKYFHLTFFTNNEN